MRRAIEIQVHREKVHLCVVPFPRLIINRISLVINRRRKNRHSTTPIVLFAFCMLNILDMLNVLCARFVFHVAGVAWLVPLFLWLLFFIL